MAVPTTAEAAVPVMEEGVDLQKMDECVGDTDANVDNPVIKAEQEAQIGKGSRGDVTILPTLVINNRQYRGKLGKQAVLKAICSGFEETFLLKLLEESPTLQNAS